MTIISEDGVDQKKAESNKLSGWLSVLESSDCHKLGVDDIFWKLKAVTFCATTKQLFISSLNGEEQDVYIDSPQKSPCLDNNVVSPKSELPFAGRSTRPRIDSQSSYGFKQFFSKKKMAISRSRSVGKMGSQKSDLCSPKSPNAFWSSWRSQEVESNTCLDEEAEESYINLSDPNISMIRPIHPSVLSRQYCFQVVTPLDMKYFSCCSEEEYYTWLHGLNASVQFNRDQEIRLDTSLSIWIFEAKGIPVRKKYFCEILLDKMLFSRTTAKSKNEMLFWGEQFCFEDLPPTESVTISLFRECDTKKKRKPDKNVFVGSSIIDLVNLETNTEIEKWVSIHIPGISPKLQQKSIVGNKAEQPSVRTKLKYETNVVLPISTYKYLLEYLNNNYLILTSTLEVSISLKTKDLLAQTLLKVLLASNKAEMFLVDIIMNEVQNTTDENLTFRGNSLATKSIDTYMKMIGKNYIQETLVSFINGVYESEDDTEVDPQKISSQNTCLSNNQKCLIKLVEDAWRCIFLSIQIFPKNLQLVFSMVRKQCEILKRDIAKKIVSASLFLRLLCPAILSPSLFFLSPEYPSEKVARTLTLVAKTIQNLANFTRFGTKEVYMDILNDFVEREIGNMDNFLQRISYEPDNIDNNENSFAGCMNIDLPRELSVIYHLLSPELAKLSPDSFSKLVDLKIILDEIQLIYESSPKADDLRLCRPFASVASVCSKPLIMSTHEQYDDTTLSTCGEITPCIMYDSEFNQETPICYLDMSLSLSEDHVSGCSPLYNRIELIGESVLRPMQKAEILPKGAFIYQSPNVSPKFDYCRCSPNTFVHSTSDVTPNNNQCKCGPSDEFEITGSNPKTPNGNTDKSLPSIPQIKQKNKHSVGNRKKHNSFDTAPRRTTREAGTVKDRINMFSKRNDIVIPLKRDVRSKCIGQNHYQAVKQPEYLSLIKSSTLETVPEKNTAYKNVSPSILIPNEAVSCTNSNKSKIHNEKVLPRQDSIGDEATFNINDDNDNISDTFQSDNESGHIDRARLKLHNLQKEHYFTEEMPLFDSWHHNQFFEQIEDISCDSSNNISDTTPNNNVNNPNKAKRHVASCEPQPIHVTNDCLRTEYTKMQRRYSDMTSQESEKKNFTRDTMVVDQCSEIAQIHSSGYCEILHEGTIECTNSITYSCSSNCSYSSESSYSDEEYGTYISGDSLSDALQQHTGMSEANMNDSMTNQRQISASNMLTNRTGQVNDEVRSNGYDCDVDVHVLRLKLRETELVLQKTQMELKSRIENFEQTVIRLKDKLIEADTKMKAQRAENETQMKNVISRLLNVEGELRNEHTEMEAVIKGKQKMIEVQEKRIKALEGSNIRLLRVLSNMKRKHSRQEDNDIDELLECLNNRGTSETETNSNPYELDIDEREVKHV